jgi:hypothetical protein
MALPVTKADWEKRQRKFLCTGMNLTVPPDLMPEGKFPYIRNFRVRQAGVLQVRDGWTGLIGSGLGSAEVHSIVRFIEEITDTDLLVIGSGAAVYFGTSAGGAPTILRSGLSGYPLTFAVEHPSDTAGSWLYVADLLAMFKVGVSSVGFVIQDWGVPAPGGLLIPPEPDNPAAVAAKPIAEPYGWFDPVTNVPGQLTPGKTYKYRYLYRQDNGAISAPSLESDAVLIGEILMPSGLASNAVKLSLTPSPSSSVFFIDIYRFGGSLSTWRRLPFSPDVPNPPTANPPASGFLLDIFSDLELASSDLIPDDNFPPFQSVEKDGTPVRRDLPYIWGPHNNVIFACGDPARPGDLYWTNPSQPDGHAPQNHLELCAPSERLVNGFLWDGRAWVFSDQRLFSIYPNFAFPSEWDGQETPCGRGLFAPWAFAKGDYIYFLSKDGIYRTNGGPAQSITDEDLYPLFPHENINEQAVVNGVQPPNMALPNRLRLSFHNGELFFDYIGKFDGLSYTLVYDAKIGGWILDKYDTTVPVMMHYSEQGPNLLPIGPHISGRLASERLLAGTSDGKIYESSGPVDGAQGFTAEVQTPADDFGDARAQKLYGDGFVEADTGGGTDSVQPLFENGTITAVPATVLVSSSRTNKIIELNAGNGQLARNAQLQILMVRAAGLTSIPKLYSYMLTARMKPDQTIKRAVDWHPFLPNEADAYVMGIKLWVDTEGLTKVVQVWKDGANSGVTALNVMSVGENILVFSWPSFKGRLGRLFPTDDFRWRVTKWEWIAEEEPTLEPDWDTNWDKPCPSPVCYITGVQVIADTVNQAKVLKFQSELEGVVTNLVPTGQAGNPTIQHDGRLTVNFSFTPFRANQVRLYTTDQVLGRLYEVVWHAHPEPPTLANWDATFIDFGKPTIIKGYELFADTLDVAKTWRVELDGVLHKTQIGTHNGRRAITYPTDLVNGEFPVATTARLLPTDVARAYLYHVKWAAEEEPYRIRNWNTSWKDFGKDMLIKGVRIETDTRDSSGVAQTKSVKVQINQSDYAVLQVLHNGRVAKNYDLPVSGTPSEFPRGRTVRLLPTDETASPLYSVEWIADEEPFLMANFNAKWEDGGYPGAKYVHGFLLTADTQGLTKTVLVEYEGGSFNVENVVHTGRRTIAYSFKPPIVAHQVRARPTDNNQSWLYAIKWLFDEHPEAGCWWETQGTTLDWPAFHHEKELWLPIISTTEVQLTVTIDGVEHPYPVASSGGLHQKVRVPFVAAKGKVMSFKAVSPSPFRVFQRDMALLSKPWGDPGPYQIRYPFGGPSRDQGAVI